MHKRMAMMPKICIFIILFLTALTGVHAFELDAPKTLIVNENATITLLDTGSETYDVKLFIGDAARPSSRIFSPREGWKDARYYLLAALPEQTEFIIQPLQPSESAQLCARLRKPSSSSYREECVSVEIENRSHAQPVTSPKAPLSSAQSVQLQQPQAQEQSPPPILLAPLSSSSPAPAFQSREARVEQGLIITTAVIILIGIVLLVFRKQTFKSPPS